MKKYSGILFIGDPHVTNISPQRRREDNFLSVTLDKLEQSIRIANKNNLLPVITGDIVNKPREEDVIVPLIELLKNRSIKMVLGNHDVNVKKIFKKNNIENEDGVYFNYSDVTIPVDNSTTVKILEASGCIEIFNSCSVIEVPLEDCLARLMFVPYGVKIPEYYPEYEGDYIGDIINIMLTHHDINFGVGKQYPGCEKIFPINNCDMVVNGHIHDYKPVQEVGGTYWFNPGNIIRTSKANMHNIPAVYSIYDKNLNIERYVLEHKKLEDVFNFDDNVGTSINEDTINDFESRFVSSMNNIDVEQTEDGSGVNEILDDYIIEHGLTENISYKLRDLLNKSMD